MNEREYLVNDYFTDGEMWAITSALNTFMHDNPHLTDEQYELCERAYDKLVRNV